jgi:uncharacterized protein YcbX
MALSRIALFPIKSLDGVSVVAARINRIQSYPELSKGLYGRSERSLPPWADRDRSNHYYRFAVNTSIPSSEGGKILCVGDTVEC